MELLLDTHILLWLVTDSPLLSSKARAMIEDSMLRALPPSGRGRRPRRPAFSLASPWTSPLARRAGDVAPYHGVYAGVGRGRGRRPRRPASPLASPWTSPLARRAEDVAPYHGVRAGVWRGRGRRPRRGDASPAVVPFGDSPGCRCDCLAVITYDIMMTFWKSKIESWRGYSRQRTRLRRA